MSHANQYNIILEKVKGLLNGLVRVAVRIVTKYTVL